MSQKQNNKFVLDRLYPEYFKPLKVGKIEKQPDDAARQPKNKSDQRVQSRLKMIIYNLQRQIQQQSIISRTRITHQYQDQISLPSQAPSRSYSMKALGPAVRSQRSKTESQNIQYHQNTQRKQAKQRFRKHSYQKQRKNQNLVLPKIKLDKKINQNSVSKQLLRRKRYKKLQQLNQRQQLLGKLVLEKVQKHFQMQKKGKNPYYERVKSQQGIDETFLTYLKNKVKKAGVFLQK